MSCVFRQVVRRRAAMALALVLALVTATSASVPTAPRRDERIAGAAAFGEHLGEGRSRCGHPADAANADAAAVGLNPTDPASMSAAPTVSTSGPDRAPPVPAPAERVLHAQPVAPLTASATSGTGWGVRRRIPGGRVRPDARERRDVRPPRVGLAVRGASGRRVRRGILRLGRAEVAAMRSAGLDVVLSDGMYLAPGWLLSMRTRALSIRAVRSTRRPQKQTWSGRRTCEPMPAPTCRRCLPSSGATSWPFGPAAVPGMNSAIPARSTRMDRPPTRTGPSTQRRPSRIPCPAGSRVTPHRRVRPAPSSPGT